jgi:hypothetical protein
MCLTKIQLHLCLSAFYCCDKTPEINKLKSGKFYVGSWFQRVQFIVVSPTALGPWQDRTSWQGAHSRAKLLTSQQLKNKTEKGAKNKLYLKGMLPVTYCL